MVKCILTGLVQEDSYSGKMTPFETEYNGIPEACAMWASGYKHCFLENCQLFFADSGIEVPNSITDHYYDRYYLRLENLAKINRVKKMNNIDDSLKELKKLKMEILKREIDEAKRLLEKGKKMIEEAEQELRENSEI